jgi:hypothetical protein
VVAYREGMIDESKIPEGGKPDPASPHRTRPLPHRRSPARPLRRTAALRPARQRAVVAHPTLSQPQPGLAGHLTARSEAHTIRLALLYALLDGAAHIQHQHLKAALALWDYAARSAAWALDTATGDPLAEQIHAALLRAPG